MKKLLLLSASAVLTFAAANAQSNYLDNYLLGGLTYTTIANSSNLVSMPRDLDFNPNSNELWIANKGTGGGARVIIYNAGFSNQTSQYRKDSDASHFDNNTSAIAFADDQPTWASAAEFLPSSGTFMGPSLWLSDTAIFARVWQTYALGSHIYMLHQSPYAMGIAHDNARVYWLNDGYNGNICKYDFVSDHSPGYTGHSSGKIWRYTDVTVTRVPNVPSHMVVDKSAGWLYFIDGGTKRVRRLNTATGTSVLQADPSNETLAGYYYTTGATVETIETFTTQPCGIDYYNNRLIVSDYTNGDITIYNTTTTPLTKLGTFSTGQAGIMGVKVGPDGKIWFVNYTANTVVRITPQASANDAGIQNITSPVLSNGGTNFHSPKLNECSTISPAVTLLNNGSDTLASVTISYKIDNGPLSTFNWTGSLAAAATASVILPAIAATSGTHKLTVYTSNPNGSTDPNLANDTKEGSFRVVNTVPFPFSEGFSSATFPPAGWDVMGYNKYSYMTRVSTVGGFGNNTGSMKMINFTSQTENTTGQIDYMMTPRIELTTAPASGTVLEFSVAYCQYSTSTNDRLQVLASTDCGNTWTSIYNKSGSTLSTATASTSAFNTPTASQWRKETISLNSYIGQNVIFAYMTTSGNGNNLFIDDINVTNTTGINENTLELNVSVYPNPASSEFTIEGTATAEKIHYTLRNVVGAEIKSGDITSIGNNFNGKVQVSDIAGGIYFIQIKSGNSFLNKKIIIAN